MMHAESARLCWMAGAGLLLAGCAISRAGLGVGDADAGNDASQDGSRDALTEDAPTDAASVDAPPGSMPVLDEVDYLVVAHGARLEVNGSELDDVLSVEIGGVAHVPAVVERDRLVVAEVSDTAPVGAAQVVAVTATARSNPLTVTVVRLVVSELDQQTDTGPDYRQFVELTTGVGGTPLGGYTLVLYGADGLSYFARDLTTSSDDRGMVVVGTDMLTPEPPLTWASGTVRDGPGAVVIHQGSADAYPPGTAVEAEAVVDALVFHRAASPESAVLLDTLLGSGPERVQVNENGNAAELSDAIVRCADERLDGRAFALASPTPGAPNTCEDPGT